MLSPPRESPMARSKPQPDAGPDRVTVVNLKGTSAEREWLAEISRKTGVPISTITRRGIALWAKKHRGAAPPEGWGEEG